MIARNRRKATLTAMLASLAAAIAPTLAHASTPTITSFSVIAGSQVNDPATAFDDTKVLFANQYPYGATFQKGTIFLTGNATDTVDGDGKLRLFVDVRATDSLGKSVSKTVTVQPVTDTRRLQGDFNAELQVTDIGVHAGTPGAFNSLSTADWGGDVLTVTATARNVGQVPSTASSSSVTKYAGTPKDKFAPVVDGRVAQTWPPTNWCHLASNGINGGGGNNTGSCGNLQFLPDATWAACIYETNNFPQGLNDEIKSRTGSSIPRNSLRDSYCTASETQSRPRGEVGVRGAFKDESGPTFGVASEISSITVSVWQGTVKLRDIPSISRFGTQADYAVTLRINDFEPNYPTGDPYHIEVVAKDAWGNTSSTQSSPNFTVYPW